MGPICCSVNYTSLKKLPSDTSLFRSICKLQRKGSVVNMHPEPQKTCQNLPDIPIGVRGAFGGLFGDSEPMYCGGENGPTFCNCFALRENRWQPTANLSVCRRYAASAVVSSPSPKLVIAGGSNLSVCDQGPML
jgi:hypothetical protein